MFKINNRNTTIWDAGNGKNGGQLEGATSPLMAKFLSEELKQLKTFSDNKKPLIPLALCFVALTIGAFCLFYFASPSHIFICLAAAGWPGSVAVLNFGNYILLDHKVKRITGRIEEYKAGELSENATEHLIEYIRKGYLETIKFNKEVEAEEKRSKDNVKRLNETHVPTLTKDDFSEAKGLFKDFIGNIDLSKIKFLEEIQNPDQDLNQSYSSVDTSETKEEDRDIEKEDSSNNQTLPTNIKNEVGSNDNRSEPPSDLE